MVPDRPAEPLKQAAPCKFMRPLDRWCSPHSALTSVLLPQPLGPAGAKGTNASHEGRCGAPNAKRRNCALCTQAASNRPKNACFTTLIFNLVLSLTYYQQVFPWLQHKAQAGHCYAAGKGWHVHFV